MYVSLTFGALAAVMVLAAGLGARVYYYRNQRVIRNAQPEFLFLLLLGGLLIAAGSITTSVPPGDLSCVVAVWLVNVGYSLELVPLLVKVSAVNRLMAAAKKMRRAKLNINHLYATSFLLCTLMICFLAIWTAKKSQFFASTFTCTKSVFE